MNVISLVISAGRADSLPIRGKAKEYGTLSSAPSPRTMVFSRCFPSPDSLPAAAEGGNRPWLAGVAGHLRRARRNARREGLTGEPHV
jgi:hypothetical protein